jgi:tetratricopeptide (TPR) repeat protein
LAFNREEYVDARAYFATAIMATPVQAPASFRASTRFGLGLTFYRLEQLPEAQLEFEATLHVAPDHEGAREHLEKLKARPAKAGPATVGPASNP